MLADVPWLCLSKRRRFKNNHNEHPVNVMWLSNWLTPPTADGSLPFAELVQQVQDLVAALLEDGEQGDDGDAQQDACDVPQPGVVLRRVPDQREHAHPHEP